MEVLFDKAEEYDYMLNQGLKITGENKHYYIDGRIKGLIRQLPKGYKPKRILDFGCGIGDATKRLSDFFPDAEIVGIDTALDAVAFAQERFGNEKMSFTSVADFNEKDAFDLCHVNGVFHHIIPEDRAGAAQSVSDALKKGGYFAYFENNPKNPGTRMVMKRIPFDRDAITLKHRESRKLLADNGFSEVPKAKFYFYFPKWLGLFRFMERWFVSWPFGAQYLVLAKK